jgi:hypothetical protein
MLNFVKTFGIRKSKLDIYHNINLNWRLFEILLVINIVHMAYAHANVFFGIRSQDVHSSILAKSIFFLYNNNTFYTLYIRESKNVLVTSFHISL